MGQSDSLDDGHGHGSPWSSTSFQIATLFLIILAVVGIAIAIFHHGSPPRPRQQPPGQLACRQPRPRPQPCPTAGGRPLLATSREPTGALRELPARRKLAAGRLGELPQSSTLGPQHVQKGVNVCFAHNPSGALLAAMNLMGELSTEISERRVVDDTAIDVPPGVTTAPAVER